MSVDDPQTDLGDFGAERPNWTPFDEDKPDTGSREQCQTCERTVSRQFARVFGDNDDVVHACPHCATYREIAGLQ